MANITYKTVITQAIQGFNRIQNKMNNLGANYKTGGTGNWAAVPNIGSTINSDADVLSVEELVNSDVFQAASLTLGDLTGTNTLKPTLTPSIVSGGISSSVALVDSAPGSDYVYIPIKTTSSTGSTTISTGGINVGTKGYIASASSVAAKTRTVSLQAAEVTKYIRLPKANLSGSITSSSTLSVVTDDSADKAGVNIQGNLLSKGSDGNYITSSTEPSSGNFIAIKATTTASGSGSIGAGWTTGGTVSGSGSTTTTYYTIKSASGFSIKDKTDKATFTANGNEFNITVSNLVGKFSSAGYIGTGDNTDPSVKVGTVAKSTLTSKVSSFSATATADNNGTLTIKPSISVQHSATAGYTAAVTNAAGTSYTTPYTISSTGLKPENIRYGVSILGVTGSFTNATNPDSSGNQQGAELRYYAVTEDDAHGGKDEHLHSLGMLKGAYAYVDGKLVVGDMNDFSVETSANNTYGAAGSGTTIGGNNVSVNGSRLLTLTSAATGYVASGVTKFTATLPAAGCTVAGGGLTKGAGSVSATGANNLTITESASQPASGFYFTTTGSGTVNRASITDAHTAGWLVAKDATTVSAATSLTSNVATKYYTLASSSLNITGAVTPSNVTLSDTDNGIYIFNASGTTATTTKGYTVGTSKTVGTKKFISKLTVPAGKALGHYTNSTNYDDGVTIKGATNSIGKLYAGFGDSGFGELYLRNAGATSYTKVAKDGALITANPSFTGGAVSGSVTITNNATSPADLGGNALVNDSETSYVLVKATGSASHAKITYNNAVSGWVSKSAGADAVAAGSATSLTADTAKIPAVKPGTVTSGTPSATIAAVTFGSATTFDETNGAIKAAGSKSSGTKTGSIGAVTVVNGGYKDKYIVGGLTAKTNGGTATFNGASITGDTTGSTVDDYVEALYKRMLGFNYDTSLGADSN